MSETSPLGYEFGPFRLEPQELRLLRAGSPVHVTPKALDLLTALVKRAGRVATKEELLAEVWPGAFVEEGNLAVNMTALRRALEDGTGQPYIETVAKRGYRFVAPVTELRVGHEDAAPLADAAPELPPPHSHEVARTPRWSIWLPAITAVLVAVVALTFYLSRSSSAATMVSLAVLPFQVLEVAESEKYLGLGLADAVITQLGNSPQFNIRPTEAVRQFAAPAADAVAAGKQLKVEHVLSGFVQRDGDRIRLTVQLVDVNSGASRWSARFDEPLRDLFALQDAVSQRVAAALIDRLTPADQARIAPRQPADGEAYRQYLQARYFLSQPTRDGVTRSVTHFSQALALDPQYALAHSGLASAYRRLGIGAIAGLSPHQAMPLAREHAERALALDDTISEAHAVLGSVKFQYDWDWIGAEGSYRRALALNPVDAASHHAYGWFLGARGRFDESIRELTRARELDPISILIGENLGMILGLAGRPTEGLQVLKETIALDPKLGRPHSRQIAIYEHLRQFDRAFEAWHTSLVVSNRQADADALSRSYAAHGYRGAARYAADYGVARGQSFQAAVGFLFLGEYDRTLEQLEISYQDRFTWLPFLGVDRRFDPLRSDPRFQDLLRRLKLS